MRIRPVNDFVIMKREKPEDRSKGGIVLPETAQQKSLQGEVLEVGTGAISDDGQIIPMPPGIYAGKTIVINRHSGTEITIQGETYVAVRAHEIIGVIE